jgi:hypothetical protein
MLDYLVRNFFSFNLKKRIMKKYSAYFWWMMILSLLFAFMGLNYVKTINYGASAVCFTIGFVFWFAGVMAPNNEKYKRS